MLSASCGTSAATVATINKDDSDSYTLQQELLVAYHNLQTNKTARDEEVRNLENGVAGASQTNVDNYQANINASQAIINVKQPQVDAFKGKYDDLWKNDTNFCNKDLYSEVEFRFKNNPKKNWVFPIITGYDYKVHFDTGVDFLSIDAEYSAPELLQGETAGSIIHFNHTERREALNFTYTHANGTAGAKTPWSATHLTSASKMGDIYFNNVTRHTQVKFDGQRNDTTKFVFKGDECISENGCNPDTTEDAEIEKDYRRWSDPKSWTSGKLPVKDEEVLIEPTWNMLYDLEDSPIFKRIEVNGRLTMENTDKNRTLRAYSIFIRKGEMVVGTEAEPFKKTMTFHLYGSRADRDVYFHTKMFEGGNKVIANTGNLTMYGAPVDVKSTRLAASAAAGATTITLTDAPSDWKEDDEIGIAPSGRDWEQRDKARVASVSGNTVTLKSGLNFAHYGAASVDASASGTIDIRAEVVHLTRNIKVVGNNTDGWGAHIVTAHNQDSQFLNGKLNTVTRRGWAIIDHVEFFNCSQYDTDKAAVRFADISGLSATDIKSKVTNSAIHDGRGIGIMVTSAQNITVQGNVVWYQLIGGIWMKASHHTRIIDNVVAGMGTRYWSGETRLDEIAAYDLCNKAQNCQGLVVTGNIAAGGQRVGFALPTTCTAGSSEYANNMAHTFEHGAWLFRNKLCTSGTHYFGNFKTYKTVEEGVIGYQGFGNIELANIETLDCGIGISPMTGVNLDNNFLTIKDTVIMGESLVLPQDAGGYCIALHGMWGSVATRGGKVFPEVKLSNLPYHKIKTYANWYTEGHHNNVTFKNWVSGTRQNCVGSSSAKQRLIFLNPSAADHAPVDRFIGTKIVNVHNDAMTFISDPPAGWAILKECGNFPCTGPDNVIFKFEGTTFSGTNTPSFSDADFQIIPTNPGASELIPNCTSVPAWNGFLCKNPKISQLVFESLDADTEDRTISPINYFGIDRSNGNRNSYNNTLNSFMDHCWDGHYTCQKRLSRFPGIIETSKKYEIYFTGTTPGNSRYTIEGADANDYALARIDFSQSVLYKVFKSENNGPEVEVDAQAFNRTLGKPGPLNISNCGDSRYEQQDFIYEFALRRNCTVYLRAQEHLVGLVRLKMSLDEFFEEDFVNKLAYALGITTNQIKIVGVSAGSVVVNYQILSALGDTASQQRDLVQMAQMLASKHAAGTLDLGAEILDIINQVISSNGSTVSAGTGSYKKKEIHPIVYAILGLSCVALLVGVVYGLIKMLKMRKVYKEIHNEESVIDDNAQNKLPNELDIDNKDMKIEEAKQ